MKLVRQGLYIGNAADAADEDTLRKLAVTHILCLAPTLSRGERTSCGQHAVACIKPVI